MTCHPQTRVIIALREFLSDARRVAISRIATLKVNLKKNALSIGRIGNLSRVHAPTGCLHANIEGDGYLNIVTMIVFDVKRSFNNNFNNTRRAHLFLCSFYPTRNFSYFIRFKLKHIIKLDGNQRAFQRFQRERWLPDKRARRDNRP